VQAVGQLTGGIAHDLNNILTVITGTIEILAEGVADRPELLAITRMIDQAGARGADLTQRLLAFARKQPLQPREVDVNALVMEAAKLLRPMLGEQVEVHLMLGADTPRALIDPRLLTSAILNLALKARDAMANGGNLAIETGNVVLDDGHAAIHGDVTAGKYVMVAVIDSGHGITAVILDNVKPSWSLRTIIWCEPSSSVKFKAWGIRRWRRSTRQKPWSLSMAPRKSICCSPT
jgi:signal transduction histidine kinase